MDELDDNALITIDEFAEWMQWSRWTAYQNIKKYEIPHLRFGRTIRLRVGTVRLWLRTNEVQVPA